MNSPLVSVIIPAYNAENFIEESIRSVLDQSWDNIEIIVVNDGSTDNTRAKIEKLLDGTNGICINQDNAGCSGAKNVGLSVAKGDYIQYLDADDILHTEKIREQVLALKGSKMDIAVGKTFYFQASAELNDLSRLVEIDTEFLYTTDDTYNFLLNLYGRNGRKGMIQPNAFLVPMDLARSIGNWDMTISPSPDEDGEYFCRALIAAHHIVYTPNAFNFYRKPNFVNGNLSQQKSERHVLGAIRSVDRKVTHMTDVSNTSIVRNLLSEQYADIIYQNYPYYKDACELAMSRIMDLATSKKPMAGGEKFRLLVKLVGFRNAINLRGLFSNFFST